MFSKDPSSQHRSDMIASICIIFEQLSPKIMATSILKTVSFLINLSEELFHAKKNYQISLFKKNMVLWCTTLMQTYLLNSKTTNYGKIIGGGKPSQPPCSAVTEDFEFIIKCLKVLESFKDSRTG